MTKKTALIIILLILVAGLIGCGQFEENLEPFELGHTVTKPVTIEFWSAHSPVNTHGMATIDMIDRFNAEQIAMYPESPIKVRPVFNSTYDMQNTKLQAALVANVNPDMAMVGVSSLSLYHDHVINLSRVFSKEQIDDIIPAAMQFSYYKNRFLGFPIWAATNVLMINKDLVATTNITLPTVEEIVADPENSPWTWDLYYELIKQITENNPGVAGTATANIPLYESFYTQGVPIYNQTATAALFNNEYGVKAFTFWQNIVKNGYAVNPTINPNHGNVIQADFMKGNIGLFYSTSSIAHQIYMGIRNTDGSTRFEFDILPYPKVTDYYCNQNGGYMIIFNNHSEEKTKASVEFLRWLTEAENSAEYAVSTGYIVPTYAARATDIWQDYKKDNPMLDKVVEMMVFEPKEGLYLPMGPAKAIADTELFRYSKDIWLDDFQNDPEDVIQTCYEWIDYILKTNS